MRPTAHNARTISTTCDALNAYHGEIGYFPSAYSSAAGVLPGWGWGTELLPFVEQKNLYDRLNPKGTLFGGGSNPANSASANTTGLRLSVYLCPSNGAPDANPKRFNHGTSNYRAVRPANLAHLW